MKIIDNIKSNTILFPLNAINKEAAIQELLNQLLKENILTSTTKLFSFIKNHDKIMNSAVGRGIAFHHSKSLEVNDMVAVLGVTKTGIDYESPDMQKVHFILLILDSVNEPNLHRKFIHRFQKFINTFDIKTKILDCNTKEEILLLIDSWEKEYLLNENV